MNKINASWRIFLLLFTFLGFLNKQLGAVEKITSAAQPSYGGTLIIGIPAGVDSFNPLFNEAAIAQEITHLLLLGLADLDHNSEFTPEIASSWQRSPDNLQLTYMLRPDAKWSDGEPITANDVKFTFDVLMDSTVASPRRGITEYIEKVVVKDKFTVSFHFSKPYPDQIFDTAGEILPRHLLKDVPHSELRNHPFGRNPISSGPFVLKKWVSQQYIELARNEHYFGQRPFLDRVIFKVVPDQTNLLMQMQTGEVDMMVGVPPAEVDMLKSGNPNVTIYPVSGRVYHYTGYNHKNPLFADPGVRRALTMAVDIRGIIDAFLNGFGSPCLGPMPPMLSWLQTDASTAIPYAPEDAKKLLRKNGWADSNNDGWLDKNGQIFEFTLNIRAGDQLRGDVAVILQDQWRQIGVKVQIEALEWSTMLGRLRSKEFDAYIGGWSTSFNPDPTPIFHSESGELFNFVSYRNPKVDKLIEIGREEMDQQKAIQIWQETQRLIYADQPYTFLFWVDNVVAVKNKFRNVTPIALSAFYNLENWYLAATN